MQYIGITLSICFSITSVFIRSVDHHVSLGTITLLGAGLSSIPILFIVRSNMYQLCICFGVVNMYNLCISLFFEYDGAPSWYVYLAQNMWYYCIEWSVGADHNKERIFTTYSNIIATIFCSTIVSVFIRSTRQKNMYKICIYQWIISTNCTYFRQPFSKMWLM